MIRNGLFASESVSEGHPDKLADRISDAVLDEFLRQDPNARVGCETLLADQFVVVAGEFRVSDRAIVDDIRGRTAEIVRRVLSDTGYHSAATGIDPRNCQIEVCFNGQSPNINQGVDRDDGVLGAGDQGLMFGYACGLRTQITSIWTGKGRWSYEAMSWVRRKFVRSSSDPRRPIPFHR
jgi:S-adenosylmethionine synthetase